MSFVKENGGVLAVAGVAVLILGGFNEWRISVAVTDAVQERFDALAEIDVVSPITIESMKGDIKDQKEIHTADALRMDSKIERIVDILLEE